MKKRNILLILLSSLLLGCNNTSLPSLSDTSISNESSSLISDSSSEIISDSISSNIESDSSSSEEVIMILDAPTFIIKDNGEVIIDEHEYTSSFSVIINAKNVLKIQYGEKIFLKPNDTITIKAISEDKSKYSDSAYSKLTKFVTDAILLPHINITISDNQDIAQIGIPVEGFDDIYVEVNGVVFESKLSEIKYLVFNEGDQIRVKLKSPNEKEYIENDWSNYVTSPARPITTPISSPDITYKYGQGLFVPFSQTTEISMLLEVNGITESLPYSKVIERKFNHNDKIRVKLIPLDKSKYSDSEWSNEVTYLDYSAINFTNKENTISNLIYDNNNTAILKTYAENGEEIELLITGEVNHTSKGWLTLTPNTTIMNLTPIHGISYLNCNVDKIPLRPTIQFGIDPAKFDTITDIEQITWTRFSRIGAGYIDTTSLANHFIIKNESTENVTIENLSFYYTNTPLEITNLGLNENFFRPYINGENYDVSRESNALDYYLIIDLYDNFLDKKETLYYTPSFSLGNLKDKNGNIFNRLTRKIETGDCVEFIVGDYKQYIDITIETMTNAMTQYETQKYSFANPTGTINNIVIPVCFKGHEDRVSQENINTIYKALGNVIDENGNITTYYDENDSEFSLSEYFNISSYNKLNINSFVTDWYYHEYDYSDAFNKSWTDEDINKIIDWFKQTYSHLDMSMFDQDKNALFDEIILINTLDIEGQSGYNRTGIFGPYRYLHTYKNDKKGTLDSPGYNSYINLPLGHLFDDLRINNGNYDFVTSSINHEYGHTLGLVDYYDQSNLVSPISSYDMQSGNYGDWNVYSKYSVGWLNPIIVDEKAFNGKDSIDIKIEASSLKDSALLIPSLNYNYNGTPFDEYIMIDLFTPDGLHKYDAKDYHLTDTGVRIYHINSLYEKRTLTNEDGTTVDIGTIRNSNTSSAISKKYGRFLIEIIQSKGINTLTSGNSSFIYSNDDLFKQGDVFDVSNYQEFFYNGLMDFGNEFGYSIKIKEINTSEEIPYAIITISKK